MKLLTPPPTNSEVREAIYAGKLIRIPASAVSLRLVAAVKAAISAEFKSETPHQKLQFEIDGGDFYTRISGLRKRLFADKALHAILAELLVEQGFALAEHALDPCQLRALTHLGHENPLAAPAYTAHRDTWYANPESQINWWMPLYDVTEAETFAFYPAYFDKPVANRSEDFDYDGGDVSWRTTGGKPVFPRAEEGSFDATGAQPFALSAGDIILFAASHLHQTVKNATGHTRFSVDFRTVHLGDHAAGKGAPNVDNRSRGCAVKDYLRLGA